MAPRRRLCLVLLLLAGCATRPDEAATNLAAVLENGRASLAIAGAVVPIPATAAVAEAARFTPVADGSGTRPAGTAALIGAPPEVLRRWLGEPGLRRREGPGEVWLYVGPACALDLVFYQAAGGMRVAHAAARANGAEPRTEATCLQELAEAGRSGRRPLSAGRANAAGGGA